MLRRLVVALFLLCPGLALADYQETGVIARIVVDVNSNLALQLAEAFSAGANAECPGNGGWAGLSAPPKEMVATILAAKATQSTVTLVLRGCQGSWLYIQAIYVQ